MQSNDSLVAFKFHIDVIKGPFLHFPGPCKLSVALDPGFESYMTIARAKTYEFLQYVLSFAQYAEINVPCDLYAFLVLFLPAFCQKWSTYFRFISLGDTLHIVVSTSPSAVHI